MKTFIFVLLSSQLTLAVNAQSIIGKWQLMKETTCIESDIEKDEETQALVDDMKSRGSGSAQVVQFKDNNAGEESTRILSRRKDTNSKNFLYKLDGTNLYILDKKSRTISESYLVEKLETDSLIISNATRACDMKVFVRIK